VHPAAFVILRNARQGLRSFEAEIFSQANFHGLALVAADWCNAPSSFISIKQSGQVSHAIAAHRSGGLPVCQSERLPAAFVFSMRGRMPLTLAD
jgi:hypothetical protein